MYRTDKRLYTTADGSEVVDENDPRAAVLLAAEGQEIQDAEAERLGLVGKKKAEPEPMVVHSIAADPPKDEPPAEDDEDDEPKAKAISEPPANKAQSRKAAEDK